MRSIIKQVVPASTRAFIRGTINPFITLYDRKIKPKPQYYLQRLSMLQYATATQPTIDYSKIHNSLPNTGGIPIKQ